jgi:hypothetical protein
MGCAAKNSSDDVQNTKDEVSSSTNDAQEVDTSAENTDAEDLDGSDDVKDTDGADTDAADDQETENNSENLTLGESLLATFKEAAENDAALSAQELADAVIANDVLTSHEMSLITMEVEPGLLNGFDNAEITGFEEGVLFAPMIGSIPFVGYVFTLADDADVDAFETTLKDNANLAWNICTEADEMVVDHVGSEVFFVMCPASLDEE